MSSPLGPTQRLVLLALYDVRPEAAPPTAAELAETVNLIAADAAPEMAQRISDLPCGPNAVNRALTGLRRRELAEKLGTSSTGARCWAITDAGRAALRSGLTDDTTAG